MGVATSKSSFIRMLLRAVPRYGLPPMRRSTKRQERYMPRGASSVPPEGIGGLSSPYTQTASRPKRTPICTGARPSVALLGPVYDAPLRYQKPIIARNRFRVHVSRPRRIPGGSLSGLAAWGPLGRFLIWLHGLAPPSSKAPSRFARVGDACDHGG